MDRREKAIKLFKEEGYNCSQSVVLAFEDLTGLDRKTLAKLSVSFGGGVGKMREVCGAVSGMAMIMGLLYGSEETSSEAKNDAYGRIQLLMKKFVEENGTLLCKEHLGLVKTDKLIPKRSCLDLVVCATGLIEDYIKENPL